MNFKWYFYASTGSNKFGNDNKLPHHFMTYDLGEIFKIGKTEVTVYVILQFCKHPNNERGFALHLKALSQSPGCMGAFV